jgi:proline iminopeptidase
MSREDWYNIVSPSLSSSLPNINYVISEDKVTKIWTMSIGEGIPIVCVSGGPGYPNYLLPVALMMEKGYKVILFDFRGCGRSEEVKKVKESKKNTQSSLYTYEMCFADIETVREFYQIKKWIMIGHSFGANMSLAYTTTFPDRVMGLVCLSGGHFSNDINRCEEIHQKRHTERTPKFEYSMNPTVNTEVNRSWADFTQSSMLLKSISLIPQPVFFLYGSNDIRSSWPIEQIANLVKDSHFIMIQGADHYPWMTHADTIKEYIHLFLKLFEVPKHKEQPKEAIPRIKALFDNVYRIQDEELEKERKRKERSISPETKNHGKKGRSLSPIRPLVETKDQEVASATLVPSKDMNVQPIGLKEIEKKEKIEKSHNHSPIDKTLNHTPPLLSVGKDIEKKEKVDKTHNHSPSMQPIGKDIEKKEKSDKTPNHSPPREFTSSNSKKDRTANKKSTSDAHVKLDTL